VRDHAIEHGARAGYTVQVPADGEHALTSIQNDRIDLMISDVVMHGMRGQNR
jgi:CheY-like chemotaxis protein